VGKMAKQVNQVKKNIVKQSIMAGKSFKQSLLDAGYALNTAKRSTAYKSVKVSLEEIARSFKATDITPDMVLQDIEHIRLLALESNDLGTAGRMAELKGRYLALFTDKKQVETKDISEHDKSILDKYIRVNALPSN
jgi:hypothetical protein